MTMHIWKTTWPKAAVCLAVGLFLVLSMALPAVAASDQYTLEDNEIVPIPEAYSLSETISSFIYEDQRQQFNGISDIFIAPDRTLYISDTANNRVVRLNAAGECTGVFTGGEKPFNQPDGLFVDDSGDIYVADTGNKRIVHLDSDGGFVEEFGKPESELLDANFDYRPSKICLSDTGYIYVVKGQTIMQLDSMNRFRGYIGQPEVGFSLTDVLIRIFASSSQKRFVAKRLPATYSNITLGSNGNLYAVSRDSTRGEIKELNSIGTNIYRKYPEAGNALITLIQNSLSLEGAAQWYGERKTTGGTARTPVFSDIAVDASGIVTVLDSGNLMLYQYDQEGRILCAFGGSGTQRGKFNSPSSIAVDSAGSIYVADRNLHNIQVFSPTAFIKGVHAASVHYAGGDYEEAFTSWQAVLDTNENYRFAHDGIANTYLKREQYDKAMAEYVIAENREGYSKAFNEYRQIVFKDWFVLILLTAVAVVVAVWFAATRLVRAARLAQVRFIFKDPARNRFRNRLLLAPGMMFRPGDTIDAVKENRGKNRLYPGLLILLAALASRFVYIFIVHFPFMDVSYQDVNFLLEIVKIVLPVVTWALAGYAISAIMNGEAKFDEMFLCSAYSMIPYILFTLPMGLISNLIAHDEQIFYALATIVVTAWQILLMFYSLMRLNNYSFWKAVAVAALSLLAMLLFWAVAILCFGLIGQLIQFSNGLFTEIRLSLM